MASEPRDCTPPPVSEERLAELVDENAARQASLIESYGYTSPQLVEFRKMLDEIRDSRTTIATLTKEHDRRGTSIREYMDMCEEYSASVVELSALLTRVRAERDAIAIERDDYRLTHLTIAGVLGFSAPASHNQICAETRAVVAERAELRRDAERLDALGANYWHLIPFDMPTGAGDADVGWKVSESHMGEPDSVLVAEVFEDDPRAAIDAAMTPSPSEVPHE